MRVMRGAEGSLATSVSAGEANSACGSTLSELPVHPAWRGGHCPMLPEASFYLNESAGPGAVFDRSGQGETAARTILGFVLYGPPDAADPMREFGLEVGK